MFEILMTPLLGVILSSFDQVNLIMTFELIEIIYVRITKQIMSTLCFASGGQSPLLLVIPAMTPSGQGIMCILLSTPRKSCFSIGSLPWVNFQ